MPVTGAGGAGRCRWRSAWIYGNAWARVTARAFCGPARGTSALATSLPAPTEGRTRNPAFNRRGTAPRRARRVPPRLYAGGPANGALARATSPATFNQ